MLIQLVLLGVGLLLIAGTYVYVAAEFSLVTVDRSAVAQRVAAGDARAGRLSTALRSLSTQLSGAQVGITVTTLALGFVMEPSLAALLMRPMQAWGLSETTAGSIAVPVSLAVATVLSMVLGELVPKNIALSEPMNTALSVVAPLRISTTLFRPLIWVLNGIANGVLRMFGIQAQEELRSARSPQELRSLVRRSADQGTLSVPTAGLLARSLDFPDKVAADVLTPRVRVDFLPAVSTANDLIALAGRTGHGRFPVIGQDADDVVGVVHVKQAVAIAPDLRAEVRVAQLMSTVPVVPPSLRLGELLDVLRDQGLQLAVVVDEYGGTAGILTLEDVVEELVGEITDEDDPRGVRPVRRRDDVWVLPGAIRPDEIIEQTGVSLPESETYETVAGLLLDLLDRIADVGDSVEVAAVIESRFALGVLSEEFDPNFPPALFDRDAPLAADPHDDVPRAYTVRLTVLRRTRRRIDTVLLSAVGPVRTR